MLTETPHKHDKRCKLLSVMGGEMWECPVPTDSPKCPTCGSGDPSVRLRTPNIFYSPACDNDAFHNPPAEPATGMKDLFIEASKIGRDYGKPQESAPMTDPPDLPKLPEFPEYLEISVRRIWGPHDRDPYGLVDSLRLAIQRYRLEGFIAGHDCADTGECFTMRADLAAIKARMEKA